MKLKSIKLIIWSVIAVMLFVLMIALYMQPSLMSRFTFNLPGISVIPNVSYDNASQYKGGNGSVKGVSSLSIDWLDGSVMVELYDGDEVVFEERSAVELEEKEQLHWYSSKDSLMLKYCASGATTRNNLNKTLTVKLPKNFSLNELDINAVSAEISVSGPEVRELDIDSVSGEILLMGLRGREMDVDSVSGAVEAEDMDYAEFDVTTISGEICLAMADKAKPESISMDTTSGAMKLLLSDKQGFTAELESVSGELRCDFEVVMTGKDEVSSGNGSLEISANSVSGGLRIEKLK